MRRGWPANPFSTVPRHPLCRAVVKRSDTSLLTTWSRVRIPPGGNTCSSVDRARAAKLERVMRRLRFRLFPVSAFQFGGGEEVAFFGSMKAGGACPRCAHRLSERRGLATSPVPREHVFKIQGCAVVKMSVPSLFTHEVAGSNPVGSIMGARSSEAERV